MISPLNNENFDLAVTHVPGLHVVRFWAQWCAPCRMMAPIFEQVSQEMQQKVHFAEVDIDRAQELAMKFRVRSIPTVLLLRDGKVIDQMVGAEGKPGLMLFINRHLN